MNTQQDDFTIVSPSQIVADASQAVQGTHGQRKRLQKHSAAAISTNEENGSEQKGKIQAKSSNKKRDMSGQWMEDERRDLRAYEYLCHVGEAKEWIEACLRESEQQKGKEDAENVAIPDYSVTELDERLRDGVLLAKLARFFAADCVGRIFEAVRLQFRHSDNTNFFLRACRKAGLPEVFLFELTDVYDKKNIPKVIYCIHALSHYLAKKGIAPRIKNLLGKLEFTEDELRQTEDSLAEAGVQLPSFGNVEGALAKELSEDVETEEEARARYWREHERQIVRSQAQVRGALARQEYAKRRARDLPRIARVQALERGRQARKRYQALLKYYQDREEQVIKAQASARGYLVRKRLAERRAHFNHPDNLAKIVRLQLWIRSKLLSKAFRELNDLDNITVSSIQSFLHIFDDSEKDLEEELELERLKQLVVKRVRENGRMDQLLNELDIKIALLVRNRITLDELIKTSSSKIYKKAGQQQQNGLATGSTQSLVSLAGVQSATASNEDVFSSASLKSLDKESRQRLHLYENLFYLLQTQPQYLSQIVFYLKQTKIRAFMDQVILPMFNFANGAREEFLLLKFFKSLLQAEMEDIVDVSALMRENPVFVKLVVHYNRGAKERQFLRDLLQPMVKDVVANKALDFETDPLAIWRQLIKLEESKTGEKSQRPYDVSREHALADADVQRVLNENLESLKQYTDMFLERILKSLNRMPYGIRYIAKELKRCLTEKFGSKTAEDEDKILRVVGNLVYYRYMNPAIVAPEGFDVIEQLISPLQRKNLAEISKMLQQIANNKVFDSDAAYMSPLNEFLAQAGQRMSDYFREVTEIPEAEDHFHMSGISDLLQTQKPIIYITPQSIYNMHALVYEIADDVAPKADEPLRILVNHLGAPVPESVTIDFAGCGKYEEKAATKEGNEVSLMLCNRLIETSTLVGFGDSAEVAVDFRNVLLEVKKGVIMMLRIQTGQNLTEILDKPATDKDEARYEQLVRKENEARAKRDAAAPASSASIRVEYPVTFAALKENIVEQLQKLEELYGELCKIESNAAKREQMGLVPIAKDASYQGLLKSIGLDIRQKQRRRAQRGAEISSIKNTLKNLEEKMKYLEAQKQSYQDYINSCMAQLTVSRKRSGGKGGKGSGRFVMPFTPQWHHMQQLKKDGKVPAFGSFKYSAEVLHKRGILVSLDDRTPNQLDKITLTISSDEPGVFNIEVDFMGIKMPQKMELKLEDLLQYQFDNTQIVSLFDGAAKVNVNLLIYLINKKFYK